MDNIVNKNRGNGLSDPTAGHALEAKKESSLYIHIPFCVRKCAYCDFLSYPAGEEQRQQYVEALCREIGLWGKKEPRRITTIFLGGGTPSLLSGAQVSAIFSAISAAFSVADKGEISIEVNPGTVSDEKLLAWKACGINRLSIGLQSTNDQELELLGRIHTFRDFRDTYEQAREQGFSNINVDLISGLPGQTMASWEKSLTKTAGLGPEHISAYSLLVEENTPFFAIYGAGDGKSRLEGYPNLPEEDIERDMYKQTEVILGAYGYRRYEISNYARGGFACRHNCGYWERREYIGVGLGAASQLGHSRCKNTTDMETYFRAVRKGELAIAQEEPLDLQAEMSEFLFLGLRMTKGISGEQFARQFGRSLQSVYGPQLDKLERNGLLRRQGDRVWLTERGIDISNYVFAEFV